MAITVQPVSEELFDDVIDSSAVGVRKPNPAIFELALRRLGVSDPRSAVFLDDFARCLFAQQSPDDLACRGERHSIDEFHLARIFMHR